MRYGAILSLCLHAAAVLLSVAGLPSLLGREPPQTDVVAVELVAMPEAPPPEKKEAEPPAPPVSRPEPPPPPAKAPPPPPQMEPAAEPVVEIPEPEPLPEAEPPPRKPVPKIRRKPPPPKVEVAKAPAVRQPTTPKPRRKPKPPPDAFQSLLKNLSQQKQDEQVKKPAPPPSPIDVRIQTARLVEAVRRQLTPCWNIPAGAKDVADLRIAIRIRLNPDGSLGGIPLVEDSARLERDPFFRAVAESALRALRDPQCMPLKLPYKQYELWKKVTFYFDPGEALGQ